MPARRPSGSVRWTSGNLEQREVSTGTEAPGQLALPAGEEAAGRRQADAALVGEPAARGDERRQQRAVVPCTTSSTVAPVTVA